MAFASDCLRARELLCGGIKSDATVDMLASKAVVVMKNLMVAFVVKDVSRRVSSDSFKG